MKLSEWAKQQGMTYRTAWQLFRDDNLPVPAIQLKNKTIIVQAWSYSAVLEAALRLPKDDQQRLVKELEKVK